MSVPHKIINARDSSLIQRTFTDVQSFTMLTRYTVILLIVCQEYIEGTPTESAAARSNNHFALDLLKSLSTTSDENIFFSPLSISAAVAMTSLGARGNTLNEIDKVFHFDDVMKTSANAYSLHETFQKTMSLFEQQNSKYSLNIANRLFAQENYAILEKFIEDTKKYYKSTLQQLDFGSGKAEGIINEWVAEKTHDKIKELFQPRSLSEEQTVLALVNAIYFKGKWENPFSKEDTKDMDFHLTSSEKQTIKMMSMKETFPYAEDTELNVQILEMPYAGDDLSMIVILPKLGKLPNLISNLTVEKLDYLLNLLWLRQVKVKFPKFRMETEYSLTETLQKLGVNSLFEESADLSGISDNQLKVSKVIHKAFIETDEEGTEAAADTGIMGMAASRRKILPPEFIADHPFFFAIVDKRRSKQILFVGTLNRP